MRNKKILVILITVFATGCSTIGGTMVLGTAVGSSIGAAVGGMSSEKKKSKRAVNGALFGAGFGALSGYLLQKYLENKEEEVRRKTLFDLDKNSIWYPRGLPLLESERQGSKSW